MSVPRAHGRHHCPACRSALLDDLDAQRFAAGDEREQSIEAILAALDDAGYAAGNVVFGMGGALLQQVNRDTQRFAMKCSAIRRDGMWHDVRRGAGEGARGRAVTHASG